jgi:hypothetical protein
MDYRLEAFGIYGTLKLLAFGERWKIIKTHLERLVDPRCHTNKKFHAHMPSSMLICHFRRTCGNLDLYWDV